jgi:hypothetical protein
MRCECLVQIQSRVLSLKLWNGTKVLGWTDRGTIKVRYLDKSLAFLGLVRKVCFTIRHYVLLILDNQLGEHFLAVGRDLVLG